MLRSVSTWVTGSIVPSLLGDGQHDRYLSVSSKDQSSEIVPGWLRPAGLLSVHDGFERSSMIRASGGCLGTERR